MSAEVRLRFEGEAFQDGVIEVGTLGSALLSIGDLVRTAQGELHPDGPNYRVTVKETRDGSFEILLELQEWLDRIVSLFNSDEADAVATALTIFGAGGLLAAAKWLRNRRPDMVVTSKEGDRLIVGQEERTFRAGVGRLVFEKKVRSQVSRLSEPLRLDGVDRMRFIVLADESGQEVSLEREDAESLAGGSEEELVKFDHNQVWLKVHTLRWGSPNWMFTIPGVGSVINARIEDEGFLARVGGNRDAFRQDDALEVVLRIEEWSTAEGEIAIRHFVERVVTHSPAKPELPGGSDPK